MAGAREIARFALIPLQHFASAKNEHQPIGSTSIIDRPGDGILMVDLWCQSVRLRFLL